TVRARVRLSFTEAAFGLAVNTVIAIGTAAVLFVGVRHVQSGVLTTTAFLVVLGYLAQLYGPLETISQKVGDLQSSFASAERAFELLDETPDVQEKPHARRLGRARGAIEFRDVSFGYGGQISILRGLSFGIPPGGRRGQDHVGEPDPALLRPDGWGNPARRGRSARLQARGPSESVWDRAPGAG